MSRSPFKQQLSAQARRDKKARDLAYAKTDDRRAKKADSQRKRRKAKKNGQNIDGQDYDHRTNQFVSVATNRGNRGEGTKKEGGKRYRIG